MLFRYARMQFQTLPAAKALTFEDVVPRVTSTRHVAAAAFYHCLGTQLLVRRWHILTKGCSACYEGSFESSTGTPVQ